MNPTLAIIADDLTGALDSAAPFAGRGLRAVVALGPDGLEAALASGAAVVAVNTLSRHLAPKAAAAVAAEAARQCLAAGAQLLLKKVDSRLRGNAGPEAEAIARVLGVEALLVAPAVPSQGRIVADGAIRGAGVEAEGIGVRERLAEALAAGLRLSAEELDRVAASWIASPGRALAVGAHGLATALAGRLGRQAEPGAGFAPEAPALILVGSQDPATAAQVAALAHAGLGTIVEAPAGHLPPPPAASAPVTVLRSVPGADDGATAAARFAAAAVAWMAMLRPRTILATGGDTAAGVLEQLDCHVLEVGGEAAPGIPWSRLPDGVTLVTKSGGFGAETALLDLLRPLRQG
jgi:D-threonate/D-erythronate kinase